MSILSRGSCKGLWFTTSEIEKNSKIQGPVKIVGNPGLNNGFIKLLEILLPILDQCPFCWFVAVYNRFTMDLQWTKRNFSFLGVLDPGKFSMQKNIGLLKILSVWNYMCPVKCANKFWLVPKIYQPFVRKEKLFVSLLLYGMSLLYSQILFMHVSTRENCFPSLWS